LNLGFLFFLFFLPLYLFFPPKDDHGQCFLVLTQEKAALGRKTPPSCLCSTAARQLFSGQRLAHKHPEKPKQAIIKKQEYIIRLNFISLDFAEQKYIILAQNEKMGKGDFGEVQRSY
jgi:hypothetical protein